jgi:hypothetical protein
LSIFESQHLTNLNKKHNILRYFIPILTFCPTNTPYKSFLIFLSPARMSLTKLSLGGNNDVIYKLFPPRESLVSGIPAGDGNIEKLFLRCMFWGHFFQTLNAIAKKLYIFKHFAKSKTVGICTLRRSPLKVVSNVVFDIVVPYHTKI